MILKKSLCFQLVIIVILINLFIPVSAFAYSMAVYSYNTTAKPKVNLNLRTGASTTNKIVGTFPANQIIHVDLKAERNGWVPVKGNLKNSEQTGWVCKSYLNLTSTEIIPSNLTVSDSQQNNAINSINTAISTNIANSTNLLNTVAKTTSNLNLRSGAGLTNKIIGIFHKNQSINIDLSSEKNGFVFAKGFLNNTERTGWVCKTYLKISTDKNPIQKAIKLTSSFEGQGYTSINGNNDNMGLSLGLLQWNIGQCTLQPLFEDIINSNPALVQNIFGYPYYNDLVNMVNSNRDKQMAWALSINTPGNKINKDWQNKFLKLCNTQEFQAVQDNRIKPYIDIANNIVKKYNLQTERALALSFDIAVQNGGINNTAANLIKTNMNSQKILTEKQLLSIIANAVFNSCRSQYSKDVESRKMTIVNGTGTVHGKLYNLEKDFNITDELLNEE